jgi:transcriptional regulator with XRE-family HTH domain
MEMQSREVVGRAIAGLRATIGWTQQELGSRVGQTQGWISRVENGRIADLTFASAEKLLGAMGARLTVTVDAPYFGDRQRQREPAHARMSAHVAARLARDGWEVATEVEVGGDRSRGWIDLIAYHAETGILLVIELKTEVHELGAIQRSLGWYEREAWRAARRLGWRPRRVIGCLLLLATEANDIRATANRDVFDQVFPGRAKDFDRVTRGAHPEGSGRFLAMVDPRSRRRTWVRPLRMDGRRAPAPYTDYADYMRVTASHRTPRRRHSAQ